MVVLLLIMLHSSHLHAGDLHQFALYFSDDMEAEDCALVARAVEHEKQPAAIAGQRGRGLCQVSLSIEEYEERFQFCYLSGFNMYKLSDPEMMECTIQKRTDDYIFLVGGADSPEGVKQLMCYFTCIGRTAK